jgi:hypothetical protein
MVAQTLATLDDLWVHYARTPDFRAAERTMLTAFGAGVSTASRAALLDAERVAPFANLRNGDQLIKRHGITGATGDLGSRRHRADAHSPRLPRDVAVRPQAAGTGRQGVPRRGAAERSQTVTATDRDAGRVRIPRAAKRLFPRERSELDVTVRGMRLRARWDPRQGPDRERSGVLAFGRGKLDGLMMTGEVLTVTRDVHGSMTLD